MPFDEGEFAGAEPALDGLFAGDGGLDSLEAFEEDESVDVVAGGEGAGAAGAVLRRYAAGEIVGDADVEGAGAAGDDVDPVEVVAWHVGRG